MQNSIHRIQPNGIKPTQNSTHYRIQPNIGFNPTRGSTQHGIQCNTGLTQNGIQLKTGFNPNQDFLLFSQQLLTGLVNG